MRAFNIFTFFKKVFVDQMFRQFFLQYVVVHVAIYRQNMPKLNNYYVVKFIRLCI